MWQSTSLSFWPPPSPLKASAWPVASLLFPHQSPASHQSPMICHVHGYNTPSLLVPWLSGAGRLAASSCAASAVASRSHPPCPVSHSAHLSPVYKHQKCNSLSLNNNTPVYCQTKPVFIVGCWSQTSGFFISIELCVKFIIIRINKMVKIFLFWSKWR